MSYKAFAERILALFDSIQPQFNIPVSLRIFYYRHDRYLGQLQVPYPQEQPEMVLITCWHQPLSPALVGAIQQVRQSVERVEVIEGTFFHLRIPIVLRLVGNQLSNLTEEQRLFLRDHPITILDQSTVH